MSVREDPALVACAGLGGVELGRRLAPIGHIDRLLGASPLAGDLVRCLTPEATVLAGADRRTARDDRRVLRSERCPSADGLDVHRVLEHRSAGVAVTAEAFASRGRRGCAAGVGYLAGLGEEALELTVDYARQRRAFGTTLAALAAVQQLLAARPPPCGA